MAKLQPSRLNAANETVGNPFFKDGRPMTVNEVQATKVDISNHLAVWMDNKVLPNVSVCKSKIGDKWVTDKSLAWSLVSFLHKAENHQAVCSIRVAEFTDKYTVVYEDEALVNEEYVHTGTTAFDRTATVYVLGSIAPRKLGFISSQSVIDEFIATDGNILVKPKPSLLLWLKALPSK